MQQSQKYKVHIEKRQAIFELVRKLGHTSLTFSTDLEPLRNQFLNLRSLQEEVITAVNILLETDELIVKSQIRADALHESDFLFAALEEQGSLSTAEAWTRLSLSWKIFMYSVRCFQDCVYKAILHAQQQHVGPQASMSNCIKGNKWRHDAAVGKLIDTRLPAYPNWFIRMRNLRNQLKSGLSVQSVWKGREHFIVLCEQRWSGSFIENAVEHALKLEFAIESLEMCTAAADLIHIAFSETQACKQVRSSRIDRVNVGSQPPGSDRSVDQA